jgi:hypothetical protein
MVSPLDAMSSAARRGQADLLRRAHSQPCSLCEEEEGGLARMAQLIARLRG